jgi:hypothetical protein
MVFVSMRVDFVILSMEVAVITVITVMSAVN